MADPMSGSTLVRILRAEGLKVVEYRNWRDHNRNHKGAWGPINGVMVHHTVTSDTAATVRLCYEGYSGLPGPLCHGVIAKDGTVYLVGNGRANHAGLGDDNVMAAVVREDARLPVANERNTDGNARFYGFECINRGDGEDPWPEAQLDAIEKASAAICRFYEWSAASAIGHLEWSYTKIDPRGFSMAWMRSRIQARIDNVPNEEEDDMPTPKDVAKAVAEYDGYKVPWPVADGGNDKWQFDNMQESQWRQSWRTDDNVQALRKEVALLREEVARLAVGGVDVDALVDKMAQRLAQ